MFFWSQYPALRVFIPLACGITLGYFNIVTFWQSLYPGLLCVCICLLVGRMSNFFSPFFLLAWISTGICLQQFQSGIIRQNELEHPGCDSTYFVASVKEIPSVKGKFATAPATIHAFYQNGKWENAQINIFITFSDTHPAPPRPENLFAIRGKLSPISPPAFPDEFDFSDYLKKKNTFLQLKVSHYDYSVLPQKRSIWNHEVFASKAGNYTLNILKSIGLCENDLSVGTALIMGHDAMLENEIIKRYAATGALHILSVSGLHVGIVYLLLNAILKVIFKKRTKGLIRLILLLSGIWCYSLATGMSTSVIRSANMLSIMVVGETLNKKGFSVNTLAASALIQCILHPACLLETGFQLSYLAVLGILTIYKPLKLILSHPNPVLAHLGSVCSVSLAAQLFTLPVSLYYFQQFPNYFLPANLIIIPVSAVVLYSGLGILIFHSIPFISDLNILILKNSLRIMNLLVDFFSDLPFAVIDNIGIDFYEMTIIYAMITSLLLFFQNNKPIFLKATLYFTCVIFTQAIISNYHQNNQRSWEILETTKGTAISIINGKSLKLIASSALHKSGFLEKKMKRHWNLMGVTQITRINTDTLKAIAFEPIKNGSEKKPEKIICLTYRKGSQKKSPQYLRGNETVKIIFHSSVSNQEPLSGASPLTRSAVSDINKTMVSEVTISAD